LLEKLFKEHKQGLKAFFKASLPLSAVGDFIEVFHQTVSDEVPQQRK